MATSHEFRAEVRKVLNIITHSLYTNREIFLRELVSNASDALDKVRFLQSCGDNIREPELPLEISITLDKIAKTLTIADTGIGMNRAEMMENLGTIAQSGSEQFLRDLTENAKEKENGQSDAANIIGRFGVGFYSVFMVADKVEVSSRSALDDALACIWTSDGEGAFTVAPAEDGPMRGTVIKAHLKEDAAEFLEKYRLEGIIRKHSAFVPFAVKVENERINTTPALWREPKFSIAKEQYSEFYQFLTHDSKAPLDVLHLAVDAPVQFNALLFIPDTAQHDFFGAARDHWGLDLYVKRVLIQRENKELLPEYLGFVKGVVDTEDAPLNISRETLQENALVRKIQQTVAKQTLTHLERLAADKPEDYAKFWKLHGKIFKLGYHDYVNRDRVAALMRFNSSIHDTGEELCSLDDYIGRAKEGQKDIWYLAAPGREAAKLNPHGELFRKKGMELIYLYEPIDEFVAEGLGKYKDFTFRSAENAKEDALDAFDDATDAAGPKTRELSEEELPAFDALIAGMQEILGDRVKDVRVSHRLADSPACLVSPDGMSSSMEKLLRVMQKDETIPQKILEINRDHPLARALLRIHKANAQDPLLADMVQALFDNCLLMDGYLKDPHALVARSNSLLERAGQWYAELLKL
ncbi:MAG: molecular chaperone HtpG [Desulfovibrionaceae bacterium]|nr:molecular chaperone HtpG [Desulfovibrionaceae bacterium]